MLVLSRKQHEKIVIGDTIITVLAVQGQRVRIGIEAPRWVPVRRHELAAHELASLPRAIAEHSIAQHSATLEVALT